jgi:hypothetical protein
MLEKICNGQKRIKILAEGDIHVGSSSGLLPPNATSFDGEIYTKIQQNPMQRWSWKNRLNDLSIIGSVDVYMFLGDGVEGQQTKIAGRTLVSTDIADQKQWAKNTIQIALDICKPKYFIGVSGTPYHIASSFNADLDIYRMLEKDNPNIKFIIEDVAMLQIGELVWGIAHPYPTTEFSAPPLEKLIKQHATEFYFGNMPKINIFARGHAHRFTWLNYRSGAYAFVIPCWQPTSIYARQKAYLTVRTADVGLLLITQNEKTLIPTPYLHVWKQ